MTLLNQLWALNEQIQSLKQQQQQLQQQQQDRVHQPLDEEEENLEVDDIDLDERLNGTAEGTEGPEEEETELEDWPGEEERQPSDIGTVKTIEPK